MNAIDTEKVGLWTNIHVFHKVGNCKIGTASQTQPPAPGGGGGAIVGTTVSGQDFKDQLQVRRLLFLVSLTQSNTFCFRL